MSQKVVLRQHAVNRSSAGDALSAFAKLVIRLNGRLVAIGDALAAPAGQTSARWLVLASVQEAPKGVAQVARLLCLTRQSVQRVADALVDEGFAEYVENPAHLRAKLLRIHPRGLAALRKIQTAQAAWADEAGAKIGERPLRAAAIVLQRVLTTLDEPARDRHANRR
jgi:DNA-binding MarR family transcriptional regulator